MRKQGQSTASTALVASALIVGAIATGAVQDTEDVTDLASTEKDDLKLTFTFHQPNKSHPDYKLVSIDEIEPKEIRTEQPPGPQISRKGELNLSNRGGCETGEVIDKDTMQPYENRSSRIIETGSGLTRLTFTIDDYNKRRNEFFMVCEDSNDRLVNRYVSEVMTIDQLLVVNGDKDFASRLAPGEAFLRHDLPFESAGGIESQLYLVKTEFVDTLV